ncbi:MAG TPA: ion channel [Bryobacteraceae bacterium]|jgi:hypothetical protein|nr:ion channel [Bryobacteraceae bacterium]
MAQAAIEPPSDTDLAPELPGYKFFLLFLFLLASLIFYPYAESSQGLFLTFRIFGNGAILLSVYAVSFRRSLVAFALVLAIPALVHHNLLPQTDHRVLYVLNAILTFAFDVFVVVAIFRRVFRKVQTNAETIFGALCVYLLVGFAFANIYEMLTVVQERAFYLDPLLNDHQIANRFDFIYYSFANMTSLGTAGIVAISSQARSLTIIEAILGVLYLAVLIARLMSAYRPGGR